MFPPLFETFFASDDLRALLGSNPMRVFVPGRAPQKSDLPYSTWLTIGGGPDNCLGDDATTLTDSYTTQIDIYGNDADSVRTIAKAMRKAVRGKAYVTIFLGEGREPETNFYRYSFEMDWITDVDLN